MKHAILEYINCSINVVVAVSFQHEDANMPWVAGYEEDELLRSLEIKIHDIVPLANNCTEVGRRQMDHGHH